MAQLCCSETPGKPRRSLELTAWHRDTCIPRGREQVWVRERLGWAESSGLLGMYAHAVLWAVEWACAQEVPMKEDRSRPCVLVCSF